MYEAYIQPLCITWKTLGTLVSKIYAFQSSPYRGCTRLSQTTYWQYRKPSILNSQRTSNGKIFDYFKPFACTPHTPAHPRLWFLSAKQVIFKLICSEKSRESICETRITIFNVINIHNTFKLFSRYTLKLHFKSTVKKMTLNVQFKNNKHFICWIRRKFAVIRWKN